MADEAGRFCSCAQCLSLGVRRQYVRVCVREVSILPCRGVSRALCLRLACSNASSQRGPHQNGLTLPTLWCRTRHPHGFLHPYPSCSTPQSVHLTDTTSIPACRQSAVLRPSATIRVRSVSQQLCMGDRVAGEAASIKERFARKLFVEPARGAHHKMDE